MFSLACSFLLGVICFQAGHVHAQTLEIELCDKFASANSSVLPYSYSNNAWGKDSGNAAGYQCTRVYDAGALWTVTYKWEGDPTVVKGYPRMRAWPSNTPLQLKSLSKLLVNANYKTFLTDGGESDQAYTSSGLVANVAMDLFVAPTAEQAIQVSPPTEVMIWPWWTPTILPLGYDTSTPDKDTMEVNGVTWSLYHGVNAGGQNVYSWLARGNVSSLNGDYAPLVKYLVDTGYLSGDLWAAQLQLGQEMKIATQETNFQVSVSELRLVRDDEGTTEAPAPAPTTTDPAAESPAPAPTTTDPPSEAPAPTASSVAPPPSTTTARSSSTSRRSTLTTTTATTEEVASPTEEAPTSTTSNAATSISQGLGDSWLMLVIAVIAGFV